MAKLLKRLLAAPFVLIAAIVVLFEEWRWDDLQRIAASVGGLAQIALRSSRGGCKGTKIAFFEMGLGK
jgi:hypothetical protein